MKPLIKAYGTVYIDESIPRSILNGTHLLFQIVFPSNESRFRIISLLESYDVHIFYNNSVVIKCRLRVGPVWKKEFEQVNLLLRPTNFSIATYKIYRSTLHYHT